MKPIDVALSYIKRGWSVIPLEPQGKRPLIEWTGYQSRIAAEDEVKEWFSRTSDMNIGIVTGAISGLAVIDIDGPTGEESAKLLSLPSSVEVRSGKGRHLYFTHPGGTKVTTCAGTVASHVDVRGDGGYVVAPYSKHANGQHYAWVGGYQAIQQPLAPFPENVLRMLNGTSQAHGDFAEVKGYQEPWIVELLKGVGEGEKHQALIRLAGYYNSKGLPKDVALALLLDWNTRNRPPAEPEGIIERVEDVYRRYSNGSVRVCGDNVPGNVCPAPISVSPREAYTSFKEALTKGAQVIPTGFRTIDEKAKGLIVGNVMAIGAWPGVGKTAFTLGLARRIAEQGVSVAYFPTEMSRDEVMRVFVASGLQIPFDRVFKGELTADEHKAIEAYLTGPLLEKLHIVEDNSPTLESITAAVAKLKPQVLILDYIQHTSGTQESKRLNIEHLVMGVKRLAKEHELAAVITSQFHRPQKDENGKPIPPSLFDFAESSQIEREVAAALVMYPSDECEGNTFPVNFAVLKNRFGGRIEEFKLLFSQPYVSFEDANG